MFVPVEEFLHKIFYAHQPQPQPSPLPQIILNLHLQGLEAGPPEPCFCLRCVFVVAVFSSLLFEELIVWKDEEDSIK